MVSRRSSAVVWVAVSMNTRRICGLARSRTIAANTRPPSTSMRVHCGPKYVTKKDHTEGVERTPPDCSSGGDSGRHALFSADGFEQTSGLGALALADWFALIGIEAGNDCRAVNRQASELSLIEEVGAGVEFGGCLRVHVTGSFRLGCDHTSLRGGT